MLFTGDFKPTCQTGRKSVVSVHQGCFRVIGVAIDRTEAAGKVFQKAAVCVCLLFFSPAGLCGTLEPPVGGQRNCSQHDSAIAHQVSSTAVSR